MADVVGPRPFAQSDRSAPVPRRSPCELADQAAEEERPQGQVVPWLAPLGQVGGDRRRHRSSCSASRCSRSPTPGPTSPTPTRGTRRRPRYVYYADGKTVLGKFAEQNRTSIDLERGARRTSRTPSSPPRTAPSGPTRASTPRASCARPSTTPRAASTQGASTITQQYVKVFYLSQDQTWSRKAKEAILSLKIQRQMSKEEILEGYLNTIYFGRGAYGIEAAARAYFPKPAKDLTVQEGAALAAIINSPSASDPADGKDARQDLKERYDYVIDGMADMGTLPSELVGTRKVYRLPAFPEIPAAEPVRRPARPRPQDGPGRARPAGVQRQGDRRRRSADHHDLHQAGDGRGGAGRLRAASGRPQGPARRGRLGRAARPGPCAACSPARTTSRASSTGRSPAAPRARRSSPSRW